MSRASKLLALATLFSVVQLGARDAAACSYDACVSPVRLFPTDDSIPGNLVYFRVESGGKFGCVLPEDPGPLTLRTADGTTVRSSIRQIGRDRVFAPDEPLPAGLEVRLEYTCGCAARDPAYLAAPRVFSFITGPSETPDIQAGYLEVFERGAGSSPGHTFYRLSYQNPDLSGSTRHLSDERVTVDGKPFLSPPGSRQESRVIQVDTHCGRGESDMHYAMGSCGLYSSVPAGKHVVEVQTTIVGHDGDLPPVRLELETGQKALCALAGTVPEPAATGVPAAPSGEPSAAGTPTSAGCGVARSRPASAAGLGLFAALALLTSARRLRRSGLLNRLNARD